MSDYRIVFNEQTGLYRIERRRWWGWTFVMDADREDYATFASCEQARDWLCRRLRDHAQVNRRWKVVDLCRRPCAAA